MWTKWDGSKNTSYTLHYVCIKCEYTKQHSTRWETAAAAAATKNMLTDHWDCVCTSEIGREHKNERTREYRFSIGECERGYFPPFEYFVSSFVVVAAAAAVCVFSSILRLLFCRASQHTHTRTQTPHSNATHTPIHARRHGQCAHIFALYAINACYTICFSTELHKKTENIIYIC